MSEFKSILKGGWHPTGKDGGKESWRGDYKGINQVAGWVGKGKSASQTERSEHVSRPLATLKDPNAFGPPPKNVNYHGGAALPNEITPHTGGLGAPLTQKQVQNTQEATVIQPEYDQPEQAQKPAPPPLPYRADRTGLRTDNLPPPPTHRDVIETAPVIPQTTSRTTPNLPPRLPSRQNTTASPPPPPYESVNDASAAKSSVPFINQSAVNRLGNAGVSVPDLGIGGSTKSSAGPRSHQSNQWRNQTSQNTSSGLSELQSRFQKMNASTAINNNPNEPTATSSPQPQAQPQAPTWQQTRNALTTANSAYKDPSSVSLTDAQSAAQTAQSAQRSAAAFRERHGETINAAQTRATQLNKKYNMTGRLNKFLEDANAAHDQQQQQQQPPAPPPPSSSIQQQQNPSTANQWPTQHPVSSPPPQSSTPELVASISRKPPPPPPPKKPVSMQAPPPVPLGTRPNFG